MKAWLNLRGAVPERHEAFVKGLSRAGYVVTTEHCIPDLYVGWNRIGWGDTIARQCEEKGIPVIVAENATWGNDFAGRRWYHLALNFHNTAGRFPVGDTRRWDALGVDLAEFRSGGETAVLAQRGIGPKEVACPRDWSAPGRIRKHPGTRPAVPLEEDLRRCGRVVTWGSGAAVKALIWGIKVESHMPNWIGAQSNTDESRIAMFRRLAWAQWTLEEISAGEPFERLLGFVRNK